jgi:periplasmic protein TonB
MRLLTVIILILLTLTSFGQDKDATKSTEYVFITEPVPSYPGGQAQMNRFIRHNLSTPRGYRKVKGKVFIEFVVNEDGSLSDFSVAKGLTDALDKSALRTVMMMPKWIPAERDKKPIRTKMVIPITFE